MYKYFILHSRATKLTHSSSVHKKAYFIKMTKPIFTNIIWFSHWSDVDLNNSIGFLYWFCKIVDTMPEQASQVIGFLQAGFSQREVVHRLNLSQSSVSRVFRRFRETGTFTQKPHTNGRRCTSERDDRFINSTSLRNRHLTVCNRSWEMFEE